VTAWRRVLEAVTPARVALALVIAAAGARPAQAQSFVQHVSDDPCQLALEFSPEDESPAAAHAHRACRLQTFERGLAAQRRQAMIAEQQARDAAISNWLATTQPQRVQRPFSIEGFVGTGLATYGAVVSWNVLRQLEVSGRYGKRDMNCSNQYGFLDGDCTRTLMGGSSRWMMLPKDFTPFIGAGFSVTKAHLQVLRYDPMTGQSNFLRGDGRAHSLNLQAGVQLSVLALRLSLEYVFEYIYYTGANLEDERLTPSEDLRGVWQGSLDADRHGIRFQVGLAF
jgi:hypothetical protein